MIHNQVNIQLNHLFSIHTVLETELGSEKNVCGEEGGDLVTILKELKI